jgi:hypothetical protein
LILMATTSADNKEAQVEEDQSAQQFFHLSQLVDISRNTVGVGSSSNSGSGFEDFSLFAKGAEATAAAAASSKEGVGKGLEEVGKTKTVSGATAGKKPTKQPARGNTVSSKSKQGRSGAVRIPKAKEPVGSESSSSDETSSGEFKDYAAAKVVGGEAAAASSSSSFQQSLLQGEKKPRAPTPFTSAKKELEKGSVIKRFSRRLSSQREEGEKIRVGGGAKKPKLVAEDEGIKNTKGATKKASAKGAAAAVKEGSRAAGQNPKATRGGSAAAASSASGASGSRSNPDVVTWVDQFHFQNKAIDFLNGLLLNNGGNGFRGFQQK